MATITTIGFDADDTLWENERLFQLTEERFRNLLGDHADGEAVTARLLAAERRNLRHYGFGIKGFVLSMIETALDVSGDQLPSGIVRAILDEGRAMLDHPVETLPGVRETLRALKPDYRLILITKGDLFDQERKLAASGLGEFFDGVEIVSDETSDRYEAIFTRHGDGSSRSAMVGNSLKSDVLPTIAAGALGVHIPHDVTWAHELADLPADLPRFFRLERFGDLLPLAARWAGRPD